MSDFIRQQFASLSTAYATGGPTPAQAAAGNYKKGRATIQGLRIAIENPRGSYRTGVSQDGKAWSSFQPNDYGYFEGVMGADGDELDVYLGPHPESQAVFVINQVRPDRSFDEHKCLLGFLSENDARSAYLAAFMPGWDGLGSLVSCSMPQFKQWLKADKNGPLDASQLLTDGKNTMENLAWNDEALPIGTGLANVLYSLRCGDGDGLLLDAVNQQDVLDDSEGLELLDALVVEYAKAPRKMEQLQKVMNGVGDLQVIAMQVTPPFKQRGTTNVTAIFELGDGQTVSVWFHNPDSTPNKILPHDELVSWRWMLNKKDITLLVAPERGQDLLPREVARRIMRLAEKNSAKFQKANADRADKVASLEALKADVATKEKTLAELDGEVTQLQTQLANRKTAPTVTPTPEPKPQPEADPAPRTYDDWFARIAQLVATHLHVEQPDAIKILGSYSFLMRNAWSTGATAEQTADRIIKPDESGEMIGDKSKARFFEIGQQANEEHKPRYPWGSSEVFGRLATGLTEEQKKAAEEAYAAGWDDAESTRFNPGTAEGYKTVVDSDELQLAYQDTLDSLFQGRIVAVRNALREHGWESDGMGKPMYKMVGETSYQAGMFASRVGAGQNIVGVSYAPFQDVNGEDRGPLGKIKDMLDMTPEGLANAINAMIPAAVRTVEPDTEISPARARANAIADALVALGWKKVDAGYQAEYGTALKSPRGADVFVGEDSNYPGVVEFQGDVTGYDDKSKTPEQVAQAMDLDDYGFEDAEDDMITREGHQFEGKTLAFAYAAKAVADGAESVGAVVSWGDFSASVSGSLFDSTTYGITGQIAKDGRIVGRAMIDEQGMVKLLRGSGGTDAVGEASSRVAIMAMVAQAVADLPAEPEQTPEPAAEPAGDPLIKQFSEVVSDSTVIGERNAWMAANIPADQLDTDGNEGVGSLEGLRNLYRLNDGQLAYWDNATRAIRGVQEGDSRVNLYLVKPDEPVKATYSEWESAVIQIVADTMDIGYGDAAGVVEGQAFYMQQSWGQALEAQAAADKVLAAVRPPETEPAQGAGLAEAKAYLQSVIDGQADLGDDGLADRLETIYNDYGQDAEVAALLEPAAMAYSNHAVALARKALG
ncbi:hypothetical protein [Pseudomonas sp.]|jgi:hypothetical protein|uniref:defense against restriction DarA-related protein n=1 Tax=Pseudomonas sp. TaxID=306 RepID=UPI002ED9B195